MADAFLAVDLGGTNLRVAAFDADGRMRERAAEGIDGGASPENIVGRIAALSAQVLAGARPSAAGVGCPGLIDPNRGLVIGARNLPSFHEAPLTSMISERLGAPVVLENDVSMAVIGEAWRGAGLGHRDVAFISLGTGVGVGLVLGGRLHRGAHYAAGEINSAPSGVAGPQTELGVEDVASGRAILRRAIANGVDPAGLTTAAVFALGAAGDARAHAAIEDAALVLARSLIWIASIVDPGVVVLGGGLAAQGEALLTAVLNQLEGLGVVRPPIVLSELGPDAQIYGAAHEALRIAGRLDVTD
jgi:predicted NBD/HSP70 family sugar kinase